MFDTMYFIDAWLLEIVGLLWAELRCSICCDLCCEDYMICVAVVLDDVCTVCTNVIEVGYGF